MAVIDFPDHISRILSRPDFRSLAAGRSVRVAPELKASFLLVESGEVLLNPVCAADPAASAVAIRHALELLLLRRLWPSLPALASLAATRTAALFARLEGSDKGLSASEPGFAAPDYAALAFDAPIGKGLAQGLRASLAGYQPSDDLKLSPSLYGLIERIWPLLGPADWLMRADGCRPFDAGLSGSMGGSECSLRPRPLEASFASASGSSISERGFGAAEAMRQVSLAGILANPSVADGALATVRGVIRTSWGLPPGAFVALAASSAEAELFAIAATQSTPDERPVTVVLTAMAEIDEGVAAAAAGRHPAAVTIRGTVVEASALVDGYRSDTELEVVELRDGNGAVRAATEVSSECSRIAATAIAAGRHVVLHRLDVSRTGLLAPDTSAISAIQQKYPGRVDVIVDASQARLAPQRVWDYLALGWIVLLSGSKFLTGPAGSAAMLVPETLRDRFARKLPSGLGAYSGRAEWPPSLVATSQLPSGGDFGLALRWSAALAEWNAFNAISPAEQQRVVSEFGGCIRSAVTGSPDLFLIESFSPHRPSTVAASEELTWNGVVWGGTGWDATETLICFAVRHPNGVSWMSPDEALQIHARLLEDLSAFLPDEADNAEQALARRAFRVGQPITLRIAGCDAGVLSIAASTRMVTSQRSYTASSLDERLARAIVDGEAVLHKISLIRRHWQRLRRDAPNEASEMS